MDGPWAEELALENPAFIAKLAEAVTDNLR